MVAGMAAPAYAGTYYIGDGDITITKDGSGTHVQQGGTTKIDTDDEITIKGGKRSDDTTASGSGSSGGSSSEGGTPATSAAKSASATLPSEDSENEDKEMVYLGGTKADTKGNTSSTTGSGEENKKQSTEKTQTSDTTDGKNTGAGSSDPESKGSDGGTSGSEGDTTGNEENDPKPGGTPTPAEGAESTESTGSSSPAPESQFTYTGASLKVADANDDEETRNESTTVLERAAENFKNTAESVTNYVIRIINKATGSDNTLNVTLEDVNIKANNDAALSVEGAGNTTITLKGDNTLTSDGQHAGLEHNEKSDGGATTGKLTITSETNTDGSNTGSLTATGSGASAGIGSVWNTGKENDSGAGTIEITGGDITAIGASDGAGIGSGTWATGETNITISGSAKIKAQTEQGGAGIGSGSGATGNTNITISGGTIENAQDGSGGAGIGSGDDSTGTTNIIINRGTIVEAVGGNTGDGIGGGCNSNNTTVTIEGGHIIKAQGGKGYGRYYDAGDGIHSDYGLTISGNATIDNVIGGGCDSDSSNRNAGHGIYSKGNLTISDNVTITNATGGSCDKNSSTLNGGSGKSGGAGVSTESGIVSIGNSDTPLDLTATAPDADNAIRGRDGKKLDEIIHLEENGKRGLVKLVENGVTRLFHNGVYTKSIYPAVSETHPLGDWVITKKPTCTEPGERQHSCKVKDCVVTETEELPALGHQWSGWTPVQGDSSREYRICAVCNAVEYRDVSHNSDSGDSTISTGLRVLDPAQADILQNAQLVRLSQISDVLYIDVSHETASLQGVLSDLTGLRSERIETVVFSTERCTSTLSLSDVAALGADDTPFTLSHSGSTASFIVGGADHTALLR